MPAVQHVYSNAVPDGTATSVVRPSDWNSMHNQFVTISGNTAGQSTVSGTNIVYQGGNNITISAATAANAATLIINGNTNINQIAIAGNTAGNSSTVTGDSIYFSAGNNITISNNAGTLVFSGAAEIGRAHV